MWLRPSKYRFSASHAGSSAVLPFVRQLYASPSKVARRNWSATHRHPSRGWRTRRPAHVTAGRVGARLATRVRLNAGKATVWNATGHEPPGVSELASGPDLVFVGSRFLALLPFQAWWGPVSLAWVASRAPQSDLVEFPAVGVAKRERLVSCLPVSSSGHGIQRAACASRGALTRFSAREQLSSHPYL